MDKATNKFAVIIVDMQDFFLKNFDVDVRKTLIKNQLKVLGICAERKLPLIVLEFKCRGIFRGETTNALKQKIKNIPHIKIIKENNSGFTQTNLDKILRDAKCKKIFIMGINANACVQDTAIGALHRSYKVAISKGTTASTSRKDMNFSKRNQRWYENNCQLFSSTENAVEEMARY